MREPYGDSLPEYYHLNLSEWKQRTLSILTLPERLPGQAGVSRAPGPWLVSVTSVMFKNIRRIRMFLEVLFTRVKREKQAS